MSDRMSFDTYKAVLQSCSEVEIYTMLSGLENKLWNTSTAVERGLLNPSVKLEQDIQDIRDMIQLGINETSRFGVINPLILDDQIESNDIIRIYTPSPEYWNWYKYWDRWRNALRIEQYEEVMVAINEEVDVPHLPLNSWLDS